MNSTQPEIWPLRTQPDSTLLSNLTNLTRLNSTQSSGWWAHSGSITCNKLKLNSTRNLIPKNSTRFNPFFGSVGSTQPVWTRFSTAGVQPDSTQLKNWVQPPGPTLKTGWVSNPFTKQIVKGVKVVLMRECSLRAFLHKPPCRTC